MPFEERKNILENLKSVDEVIDFADDGKGSAMNALHKIKDKYPDKTVLYISSEKFTQQFIDSVKSNTRNDFIHFYQMIDFQTEYTKELHSMSDYPKIDFELIRENFKEWEHHKVEDILTYRNKSFPSPVTGSVAPVHHTKKEKAMDDSMKTFLNK